MEITAEYRLFKGLQYWIYMFIKIIKKQSPIPTTIFLICANLSTAKIKEKTHSRHALYG